MASFHKYLLLLSFVFVGFTVPSRKHSFKYYSVQAFNGRRSKLIIKGNPLAEEYKTIISDTYNSKTYVKKWHGATGLNFAGHYCFVYWGCGSPCQESVVVDLKTGIVYRGVDASLGYEFKPNSRLVVVNPGTATDDCAYCKNEFWAWDEQAKKFQQIP